MDQREGEGGDEMNREEKQAWLDGLVEGDEILLRNRVQAIVVKVDRITKTRRIYTDKGLKFNTDGSQYGGAGYGWQVGSWGLEPITEEYWQELDMKNIVYQIRDVNWNTVSYAKLKKVQSILLEDEQ